MRRFLFVSALALLPTACAQLQFQAPTTQLVAVEVAGLGLEGGALRLLLDVHNPNAFALRTLRIAFGIDLDSTHFGDVALTEEVALPAGQTTQVRIPLNFSWTGVGIGARSLLGRGAVRYDLDGQLTLGTPLGEKVVPVRGGGEVTLEQLMR
jgi:LEA14-like dessication related protein